MRLKDIGGIEEANDYLLKEFIPKFNDQFAITPKCREASYIKLDESINLNEILCMVTQRIVSAGQVVSYENAKYVLDAEESLAGKRAEVREYRDGKMSIYVEGREVDFWLLEGKKKAA
tara:strand:+ start:873 stop:1226 length:354 start_codon:yes stop_codon:yes gene_type:complete